MSNLIRLGTRGSLLARTQSQQTADALMRLHPGLKVELVIIKTTGDQVQDKPLADLGGKGLFTKELELALLNREVDFAVHSFKDVPVTMPLVDQADLIIAAVPMREDPRDVLVTRDGGDVKSLPKNARVGTGSLRRAAQLLALRDDIQILPIRGNIDTRFRKVRDGEFDATILAAAGLKRAGLFDAKVMHILDDEEFIPAAAQGALALQCRRDDEGTKKILAAFGDRNSLLAVEAERGIVLGLNGDCHSPIAALAKVENDQIKLRVAVGHRNGKPPLLHASSSAAISQLSEAVDLCLEDLRNNGVEKALRGDR